LEFFFLPFISLPENPRLLSLGMNGTRSEAEANHLFGMKLRPLGRRVFIFISATGALVGPASARR